MIPKSRRKLFENIMTLYRNNLRDNIDMDAIMLDKYIKAVETISEKISPKELQYAAMRIQEERMFQHQLSLFAVTPNKNPVGLKHEGQILPRLGCNECINFHENCFDGCLLKKDCEHLSVEGDQDGNIKCLDCGTQLQ